jgi:hypothetical protein
MKHDFEDQPHRAPLISQAPADIRPHRPIPIRIDAAMDVILLPRQPQRH